MQFESWESSGSPASKAPPSARWRLGIAAFAGLIIVLCSGATSSTTLSNDSIGSSKGEVVGAAVGVGAALAVIVVLAVKLSNGSHSLDGCVLSGPNGLELQTSDSKRYALEGDASSINVGDRVKVHGSRVKKTTDSSGDQVYHVDRLSRDFGPCPAASAAPALTRQ